MERELGRIVDRAFPDPDARKVLAGRHLAIHLLVPKLDLYLALGHLGVHLEEPPGSPPDLSLTGSIADFCMLFRGETPPGLRMAGDLGWIRAVETLTQTLSHERPAWIVLLLGEGPAALINPGIDRLEALTHQVAGTLQPWMTRALVTSGCGVDRREGIRLKEALDILTQRIEDLERRLGIVNDTEPA